MIFSKALINLPNLFFLFSFTILIFPSVTLWGQGQSKVFYEGDQVRIQQKEKIITITGNAFIRKAAQGLKADKIVWYQNREYAEAFENVSFLDREQGVLYKGNYVKFLIEKDTVFVRGKASIENRKEKIIIFADTFEANTKSGSIKARGNTRMNIDTNPEQPINTVSQDADYSTVNNRIVLIKDAILKTTDQWFSAERIDINQNSKLTILDKKVRIEDSPVQKKKNQKNKNPSKQEQNSLNDSVLTCDRSKIFTETKYLECFDNVILDNKSDNSVLKSQYFLFDNPKEEILATGKVSYHSKSPTNERYMFSQYMKIYQKDEHIYFTNEVVFIDIEGTKTNLQLDCYSMKYVYAENAQDLIECHQDVVIYNPEEGGRVFSDYLFYQMKTGVGYVEKKPYYLKQGEVNDTYFYSQRMDLFQKKSFIKLNRDVLIVDKERSSGNTNSTMTCNRGEFLYNTANSNDTFICFDNVDVFMVDKKSHFYGDKLTYYLQKDFSHLVDNERVRFDSQKSPTNRIRGTADFVENYHDRGYSIMSNKVDVTELVNGRPINRLQAQEIRYHFQSQSNAFESYRDVVFVNLENNSTLYSDYLFYNLNSDIGWAQGRPVLINLDKEKQNKNLIYADTIQLNNSNNHSYLKDNIYIFEDPTLSDRPPRTPKIPRSEDYLNCQEAYYYFQEGDRTFECIDKMHLVDKGNRIDVFSDYMIYNLETEYGFLKDEPYLVSRRNSSNTVKVYSDTMEFFRDQGVSLFHSNVFTEDIDNQTEEIRSTIECDDSKYVFGSVTNTVECFKNVKVINHLESYVITSDYLRHQVDEDYSYVSDKARVVWSDDENETVVTADLLESFGEENLLYAKGKVKVDNGENQAESSLGIYEPQFKKFTLYGSPLVRDKEGSEFTSQEVYFDVVNNRMTLGSDVEGNFIPEGFLDQ